MWLDTCSLERKACNHSAGTSNNIVTNTYIYFALKKKLKKGKFSLNYTVAIINTKVIGQEKKNKTNRLLILSLNVYRIIF